MTFAATPSSARTLKIAERQLAMLGRLAELAMDVSEAFASSAVECAKAEKMILAEEYFVPEVGRARACGAKDASESFQKASRAVRLTLMLEKKTAEWVDDLESGAPRKDAGEDAGVPADRPRSSIPNAAVPADSSDRDRRDIDREGLIEFDRLEQLPADAFHEMVDWLLESSRGADVPPATLRRRGAFRPAADPPARADPAKPGRSSRTATIRC